MPKRKVDVPAQEMKLGKKPPKLDKRTLKFSDYLPKKLAAPPVEIGYIDNVKDWPVLLNDQIGDCTVAAAAHMIEQWTTYANPPGFTPSDRQVLIAYEAVSGYRPDDPWSDNGAFMLDVLNYWRKLGIGAHKILAYVSIDPVNEEQIKQAIWLFGNAYIGVSMPISAQQPRMGHNGKPLWAVPDTGPWGIGSPGSWGGHAIPLVGYGVDDQGNSGAELVSWGGLYDVSWKFISTYCDEAYCVLSQDWIDKNGLAPSHFNLAQLQQDLQKL